MFLMQVPGSAESKEEIKGLKISHHATPMFRFKTGNLVFGAAGSNPHANIIGTREYMKNHA